MSCTCFTTHLEGLSRVLVFTVLDVILNRRGCHRSLERHGDELLVKHDGGLVQPNVLLLQLVQGVLLSYHYFVLSPDLIVIPVANCKYLQKKTHWTRVIGILYLT